MLNNLSLCSQALQAWNDLRSTNLSGHSEEISEFMFDTLAEAGFMVISHRNLSTLTHPLSSSFTTSKVLNIDEAYIKSI